MKKDRFTRLKWQQDSYLKNRVVLPPMASGTANEEGFVTQKTLDHYERLAKSGAGLMFVEYTYVNHIGRSESNQLGIQSDLHTPGLRQIAKTLAKSGTVTGIQLTYSGGKSNPELSGGSMWGPSPLAVPARDRELLPMQAMNLQQIKDLVGSFAEAARRAHEAGFDLVELHCAHGYGINQWLSPLTNKRQDAYGGSLENRFRLLKEIIFSIQNKAPDIEIAARIPGQDLLEGGLSISDMQWVCQQLERVGLSIIDVSSGLGGWKRPRDRRGQGYLVEEAAAMKKATYLPVIGVGGITEGGYIDQIIAEQKVDLAAVGRAILKDPEFWRAQNLTLDLVCCS